jgi:hypothetical protein
MNNDIERGGEDPASHQFRAFVKVLMGARTAALALGDTDAQAGAAAWKQGAWQARTMSTWSCARAF